MDSLKARLHLGLSLSLGCLMLGIWWLGHSALQRAGITLVHSRLQHDAEALMAALDASGKPQLRESWLTPVYRQPYSGHYFVLETASGHRLRSRSLWDWELETHPLAWGETTTWQMPGPDGQQLLVWGGNFRKGDQDFVLAVAEDIRFLAAEQQRFQRWFGGIAVLAWLLMILLQRAVVRHSFRQLQPLYEDMERLERGEIQQLGESVPREILPLVRKFNRLLQLFAQRLAHSRNAAGNLAHALKGPINRMFQCLENAEAGACAALLKKELERIHGLMERELKRSRLAGAGSPGQRFDPYEELPALIQVLRGMYAQKSLDIRWQIELDRPLTADREDMLELLGNLLDNACKWADHRVHCSLVHRGGTTKLTVEDDGPGCSDAALNAIGQRGVRLDEEKDGHGLGLAIVKDIAELYGGQVAYGRSSLGGFWVQVRF